MKIKYYKSIKLLKLHLFFIRINDYIRLKINGEIIVSQNYTIMSSINSINNDKFFICKLIYTKSMIDDIKNYYSRDFTAELEQKLVDELSKTELDKINDMFKIK